MDLSNTRAKLPPVRWCWGALGCISVTRRRTDTVRRWLTRCCMHARASSIMCWSSQMGPRSATWKRR
eukprot:5440884-Prymnesium_polylepis.1